MSVAVVLPEVSHPYLAAIFHFILGFLSCFFNSCCLGWLCTPAASLLVKVFLLVCWKCSWVHPVLRSCFCGAFPWWWMKMEKSFLLLLFSWNHFHDFTRLTVHPPAVSRAFVWMRGFVFATLSLLKPVGSAATVNFFLSCINSGFHRVEEAWDDWLGACAFIDLFFSPHWQSVKMLQRLSCICQTVSTSATHVRTLQEQSSCVKALTSSFPLMRSNYPEHIHKQHHFFWQSLKILNWFLVSSFISLMA